MEHFLTDVQTLRKRTRQHIAEGEVSPGYSADREMVLKLLNDSLATEIVCVLRYRRRHFMAKGIQSKSIADEFLVHSKEEKGHADQLVERIVKLGSEPNFSPEGLDSYRDIIQYHDDKDPTTRRMLESILAVEAKHADELAGLLQDVPAGLMAKRSAAVNSA
jgi:bacterioferritin